MEKLIDSSLKTKELADKPLHPKQYAYQEGKGNEEAFQDITTNIEKTLKHKETCLAVFIGTCGVFDHTSIKTILEATDEWKIRPVIKDIINFMLSNRITCPRNKRTSGSNRAEHQYIKPIRGCPPRRGRLTYILEYGHKETHHHSPRSRHTRGGICRRSCFTHQRYFHYDFMLHHE